MQFIAIFFCCSDISKTNLFSRWKLKFKKTQISISSPLSVQQRKVIQLDMEVKLSISSSRRISFASDFKDFDLEVEELEKERDNPTYRGGHVIYNSDSDDDDDDEGNYVNLLNND